MTAHWIIKDWAGNLMNFGRFESFEDAWGYLYEKYDHLEEDEFNETMGEYYVFKESTNEH